MADKDSYAPLGWIMENGKIVTPNKVATENFGRMMLKEAEYDRNRSLIKRSSPSEPKPK